jgi:[NiFe] hydrogenase assembly HybE family chaperone
MYLENPQQQLSACFNTIAQTRMAGLPLNHPGLKVSVIGMQAWQQEWLGVLLTPWCMNLVLLPGPGGQVQPLGVDQKQSWHFPLGEYRFMGGYEPGLGHYQTCSLFSPVFELVDQASAELTATTVLTQLLTPPSPPAAAEVVL